MSEEVGVLRSLQSQITVEWDIQEYCNQPETSFTSPNFLFSSADFSLIIFPVGDPSETDTTGWISLYLLMNNYSYAEVPNINYTMGIMKIDGSVFHSVDGVIGFDDDQFGSARFLESSKFWKSKSVLLDEDILRVFCSLRLLENGPEEKATQASFHECFYLDTLSEDLKRLCHTSCHSDVTIKVKGQEFQAHKSVLSARSSVFASMFGHDTKENSDGVVDIPDCDPDSFKDFLLFVYTGKAENVSGEVASRLYKTADKYDLKQLKEKCLEHMSSNLSVDSFCDVFLTASLHNEHELMESAAEFFIGKIKVILPSSQWQSFMSEYPTLANELLIKMVNVKNL